MTYAVRFTSLKGKTAGRVRIETYETASEARFAADMMRDGGHRDARVITLDPVIADLRKVARVYETFGFPAITDQVIDDLEEWSEVARTRIIGFIRNAHINPAMRSIAEGGPGA
jgi:hypothetical protein